MKSKSLFFRLMKEDIKRRIWTVAISVLVMFLLLPVASALMFENYTYGKLEDYQIKQLLNYVGPGNEVMAIVTIAGAIICGLSGFFYLLSRKKVDLYHSIPVRRETLFTVSYINGLLIYIIPYIFNLLLSLLILCKNHLVDAKLLAAARDGMIIHILFFCMIYTTAIIAIMLTGNIVVSCLGTAVFMLYGPFLVQLKNLYYSSFFTTYFDGNNIDEKISFLSPVGSYIRTVELYKDFGDYKKVMIISVIVTVILLVIALLFYKKRPSEASGNAMAFKISKPIISFLLVIPISLCGGVFLRNYGTVNQDAWYLFGLIFTLIITYAIIQVIYNFDIRSIFHNKKHLLICGVVTAAITCIFRFDLFHYDIYQPMRDKIESMAVSISGIDEGLNYFEYVNDERDYINEDTYQLDKMKLTNFNAAYLLAKRGIESSANLNATRMNYNGMYYANNIDEKNFVYRVKYNLKSGREVYRTYSIPVENKMKYLKEIYADNNFKEVHFPLYQWKEDDINQVFVSYGSDVLNMKEFGDYEGRKLNDNIDTKDLIHIYKEDLNQLSLDEVAHSYPIAKLTFRLEGQDCNYYNVYPSFTKTLNYLNEHGFDTSKTITSENVAEVLVNKYGDKSNNNGSTEETLNIEKPISYKDKKDIDKIMPFIVLSDHYGCNNTIISVDESLGVTVNYRIGDSSNVHSVNYCFLKDQVPDFVKDDLKSKEK